MSRHLHRALRTIAVLVALVTLAGCNSTPRRDPEYAASYPAAYEAPAQQVATGSIYQHGHDLAFFEDIKARRIGDILTVRLTENNNAQKKSDTAIGRSNATNIQNPTILGATPQFNLPKILPLSSTQNNTLETNLAATNDFSGNSDSSVSNKLTGDITVTVADVLPNGYLMVRGEKRLNINQGNEYIKISGLVRPIDIAADNSVPSTRVADATIIYNGDGATADANRAGWLTRFFASAASPF